MKPETNPVPPPSAQEAKSFGNEAPAAFSKIDFGAAVAAAEQGKTRKCPHCGAELLWSEDRGPHCDGCDDFDPETDLELKEPASDNVNAAFYPQPESNQEGRKGLLVERGSNGPGLPVVVLNETAKTWRLRSHSGDKKWTAYKTTFQLYPAPSVPDATAGVSPGNENQSAEKVKEKPTFIGMLLRGELGLPKPRLPKEVPAPGNENQSAEKVKETHTCGNCGRVETTFYPPAPPLSTTPSVGRIQERVKLLEQLNIDACEDDTAVRNIVRPILGDHATDGDSYGVPGIVDLVEELIKSLLSRAETAEKLAEERYFDFEGRKASEEAAVALANELLVRVETAEAALRKVIAYSDDIRCCQGSADIARTALAAATPTQKAVPYEGDLT